MITKITEANKELYYSLFEEINNLLGLNIDTVEEYFLNLAAIAEYVNAHEDKTYFLRLPTDEKLFEINANTRVINVPDHFKKNGIAVVGDSYAETVWFKIDKYFDIQDLGTDDIQIRIYWELPGTKAKGYSVPQFKDVWSEAGQVLFGWTIPSLLTENSGSLTFSVSFFDDGEVDYQFNTLPQTVKINANPFKKDETYAEDLTSKVSVLGRLKNSASSAIFVAPPVFSIIKPSSIGANEVFVGSGDYCELVVTAYTPLSTGADVEYFWFKGGQSVNGGEIVYLPTEGEFNSDKVYYASEGGDALTSEEAERRISEGETLYEKGSKFNATEIGNYQVKAISQLSVTDASGKTSINQSRPSYSSIWVFEAPNAIDSKDVSAAITENGIIHGGDNDPVMQITYPREGGQQQYATWQAQIYRDGQYTGLTSGNSYPITTEGEYYAKIIKTLNNRSLDPVDTNKVIAQYAAIPASVKRIGDNDVVTLGSAAPALEYDYKGGKELNQTYEYIYYVKGKNETTWKPASAVFTSEPNNYHPTSTGFYTLIIKSTYKKDVALSKDPERLTDSDTLFRVLGML